MCKLDLSIRSGVVLALLTSAALLPVAATAQSGGIYDLTWSTIDGGGTTVAAGGSYQLGGTAGQPDAGSVAGGIYTLLGGFWHSGLLVTGVEDDPGLDPTPAPLPFRLHAAAPNPFNPRTRISFDLPRSGPVRLAIYDLRGALVRVIENGTLPAGHHVRVWDGTDETGAAVASGAYLMMIDAGEHQARQKAVLLK